MPSLHIVTLTNTSFKNLTPGRYTFNYGNYKMQSIKYYTQSLKVTSTTKRKLHKMCHLRHRLRIFLFPRKMMFRSQDIQVFLFLTIP